MLETIIYIAGLIANASLFVVATTLSYRRGVKDGARRAIITVMKDENLLEGEI